MTNEEKILAKLDELVEEMHELRRARRPLDDLKKDLEPIAGEFFQETVDKLGGLDRQFCLEDLGELLGQTLSSSKNLVNGLKTLNRVIEFQNDFAPISKELFQDVVDSLDGVSANFRMEDMQEMLKQTFVNMKNISETLHMLNSLMEFKTDAEPLIKVAFNEGVDRLESLKRKGVFAALDSFSRAFESVTEKYSPEDLENMAANMVGMLDILHVVSQPKMQQMLSGMVSALAEKDLSQARPIKGAFGMLGALKRPEVQEGLGVLIELSTVMGAMKPSNS
jgi:uncharacterized protein YjgD (DUF1641 family)/tetrahydromethanopterin S-methyltransferase subunit G